MKFPDINAFYGGFQGTSIVPVDVKPEYVDDYEVGTRYKVGGLVAELNAYQENFRNTFVTSTNPTTQLVSYSNAGSSRYRGLEMQLNAAFGKLLTGELTGYLSAAYNQAIYTTSANIGDTGAAVLAGQHVTNVPEKLFSAGLVWNWNNWRFEVDGRYVGLQHLDQVFAGTPVDTTTIVPGQPTHIPPYFKLSVGIVKVVPLDLRFAKALRFSVNGENLLNKRYFAQATTYPDINGSQNDVYGILGAPRAVYGSVSVYF
jgi:outer membrane receptor protein involved in Fe transport